MRVLGSLSSTVRCGAASFVVIALAWMTWSGTMTNFQLAISFPQERVIPERKTQLHRERIAEVHNTTPINIIDVK